MKDPDNGKVREHVKDATKLIMERTGLIERQEDGTYRIPNEQLYKDTIYTIGLRLDRERALRAMLDVSTKVQEKALKTALGIFKSDREMCIRDSLTHWINCLAKRKIQRKKTASRCGITSSNRQAKKLQCPY